MCSGYDLAFTAHLTNGSDNRVNATVMGSKQAEKEAEIEADPDTSDADGGAIVPAERVS
jgi:hypothetical protein